MKPPRRQRPLSPRAQARFEQGCAEHAAGRFELAEECFRAVLAEAPQNAPSLGNLAEVLHARRQLPEALAAFSAAIRVAPGDALLRNNHGCALLDSSRPEEARAEFEHAIELQPGGPAARANLANALLALGRLEEARDLLTALIAQSPGAAALASLGAVLVRLGQHEQAIPHLLQAIQLNPRSAEARATLAGCLASIGFIEESLQQYQAALQLRPGQREVASAMLFTLHHGEGHSREALFAEARRAGEAIERAASSTPSASAPPAHASPVDAHRAHPTTARALREPHRRLRVGYVSPDLRRHPVGFFLAPVVEAHDRAAVELVAYSDTRARDPLHQRLRAAIPLFRDTAAWSDSELATQIERDQIDVLVDLAGHTSGNRLSVFARRPAPVQISWLGYPDTTGLSSIGWRITDAIADPPGDSDAFHTERLLRLPHCFIAWVPAPNCAPAPAPPSAAGRGVSFGCFNNIAKLSPRVAALWSALLSQIPSARLLLKSRGLALPESRARLLSWFTRAGIAAERIALLPFAPSPEEALRDYALVDIALDPFPYNGTTTSCEALSMGVPLVTLRGASHAGRVSASILESLELRELVASSEADYLHIAAALARDPARLATLRRELPTRFANAPVGDPKRLARELEAAYRQAWLDPD